MKMLWRLLSKLGIRRKDNQETKVLMFVRERRAPTAEEFRSAVIYFKSGPEFSGFGYAYRSEYGTVNVCDDIYGYEVHLMGGQLLDLVPEYYRLTREQANQLESAILSGVPGSCSYAERFSPEIAPCLKKEYTS